MATSCHCPHMEFEAVVRRRRMTRRFAPDEGVPSQVVADLVALAQRSPTAGFSQGWDMVALEEAADRRRFFDAAIESPPPASPDPWLAGVSAAPVLLLCVADPQAYLDRYAEPDKGWTDRALDRWPIPYWDTDTAMAAMVVLLGATDRGFASLFFGVPASRHAAVRVAFDIPHDRRIVGVIALGRELRQAPSPSLRRGRRPLASQLHRGRFGTPGASR